MVEDLTSALTVELLWPVGRAEKTKINGTFMPLFTRIFFSGYSNNLHSITERELYMRSVPRTMHPNIGIM